MEAKTNRWKPQGGFWLALLVDIGFIGADILGTVFLHDATAQLLVDSLVRVVFGLVSLWILVKFFDKGKWRNIIHTKNLRSALFASGGMIVLILMETIILFTKTPSEYWKTLWAFPWQLLVAELICQQLATGFFEELQARALLVEGYYQHGERNGKRRLLYGLLSGVVFGLEHFQAGIYTMVFCAMFGLAMAAIYLHSHNILVPMLLHFIQNLVAHTMGYETELVMIRMPVHWILQVLIVVWAVIFLLLPEKDREK